MRKLDVAGSHVHGMCDRKIGRRTTTSGVVTGLLAEESRVLHYIAVSCCGSILTPRSASPKSRAEQVYCRPRHLHVSTLSSYTFPILPFASLARVRWCVRTLRAEELAGDVKGLASHDDDLLAVEELLGDGAGEATEQVALAVDDLKGESARHSGSVFVILRNCGVASRRRKTIQCLQYWHRAIGAYVQ